MEMVKTISIFVYRFTQSTYFVVSPVAAQTYKSNFLHFWPVFHERKYFKHLTIKKPPLFIGGFFIVLLLSDKCDY
jgi:hypothetical protein